MKGASVKIYWPSLFNKEYVTLSKAASCTIIVIHKEADIFSPNALVFIYLL